MFFSPGLEQLHTAALRRVELWKKSWPDLGPSGEVERVMNVARLLRDLGQLENAQLLITNILAVLEIDENAVGKETDEDPQREIYLAKDCLSGIWRRLGKI